MAACRSLKQNDVCPAYVVQAQGYWPYSSAGSTPILAGATIPTHVIPTTHSLHPGMKALPNCVF